MRDPFIALLLLFAVGPVLAAEQPSREKILSTFASYETLNSDFISSVGAGVGRSGKSYAQLRKEVEAYSEGPFEEALSQAQAWICATGDRVVLDALIHVVLATLNSASEAPTTTLAEIASCRPAALKASVSALPHAKRRELASRAPELKQLAK